MKPLTIQLCNGQERKLQSVGWKAPREGDCRCQFYALDESENPLVVTPKPAGPEFWSPGCPAVLNGEPFPEMACVEISPCRLLPPPCYQSPTEFENELQFRFAFDPWRGFYWQTHREVLVLHPSDSGLLQERLNQWLVKMRTAYEYNAGKRREVINRLEASTLEVLRLATEDERADRLKNAKEQLDIVESETPIDGIECKGRLKLTLEGVLRGEEGIRDEWMVKNWAKKNNFDLQQMARERRLFRKWLEMHTGTPTRNQGIWPPHFGEHAENKPQFLEACAKVRYRARFADNTGTVVYLADCELNEEPSVPERDEVVRLLGCTTDRREATAEAEQLSLDVVLNKLGSTLGKKGFVPMGVPGFIKLCKREGISLETVQKKGMKRAKLESLLKKRESQKRKRKSQLKNHTKAISKGKLTENPTRVGSKSNGDQATEAPEGSHIAVGGSLGPLEKKLREIDEGKRLD